MKGYFRKRGEKWSFTIDIGLDPITGKRKQKTVSGFKTKKEAQLASATIQQELASGIYVEEKNITFKDFSEEWLKHYANTGRVKSSSVRSRTFEAERLLQYFASIKIKDISRKMYQEAINKLSETLAGNTLRGTHVTGKMIFSYARELGVIKVDPTEFTTLPKTQKTVEDLEIEESSEKYMEKEELALFLSLAKEKGLQDDELIFKTLAYTGLRAGELCALKWRDIDFDKKTISIIRTLHNPNNLQKEYSLQTPKTKASRRVIEVDTGLLHMLEDHKAKQNIQRMRLRKTYHDEGFLFTNPDDSAAGYPLTTLQVNRRMVRLMKLSGIPKKLTPHSLRHTHTSLLSEAGVGLQEIMERLGHKDDAVTKQVYLHVTKDMKKGAAEKFSSLMKNL